eukprot:6725811-Prymnesium_polylepis.1
MRSAQSGGISPTGAPFHLGSGLRVGTRITRVTSPTRGSKYSARVPGRRLVRAYRRLLLLLSHKLHTDPSRIRLGADEGGNDLRKSV